MQIEKLKKNNYKIFSDYIKKNFKKNHIFSKSKKVFDWQYLSEKYYNLYILKKDRKIKAIQGYIPTNFYDNKLKKDSVFLSLWSSSKAIAGSKLYFKFFKKEKYNLVAGLGSSNQSFAFQKMLNFNCGNLEHFFLTSNKLSKKLVYPKKFSNFKNSKSKINYEKLNSEKEILRVNKKIFNYQIPQKSPRYLINRYLKHPFYKYDIYSIKKNLKIIAIFVFRICNYKKNSAIRIIDFIGSNSSFPSGKYLFKYLLKKNLSEYIDIYSYGIPKKYLKSSDLENVENYKKKKLIIPNYYEPFIKKNIKLPYAYKLKKKTNKNIRFFKGDSDLDRLNIL